MKDKETADEPIRMRHYVCDDCWYSCPRSGECCDDNAPDICTCGADEINAYIASLEAKLTSQGAGPDINRGMLEALRDFTCWCEYPHISKGLGMTKGKLFYRAKTAIAAAENKTPK